MQKHTTTSQEELIAQMVAQAAALRATARTLRAAQRQMHTFAAALRRYTEPTNTPRHE